MEYNIDWLFDDTPPCVDSSFSNPDLRTKVKCEPCCEDQLHSGTRVKAERCVKEEMKEKRRNHAVTGKEEKVCWLFEDWPGGSEEKEESDFQEQVSDGTGVESVSAVKEEVQVKEEREDQSGVMPTLSDPGGCGACDYQRDKAEESFEYRGLQYVLLRRVSETDCAQEEQGMEGVSEWQQVQGGGSSEGVSAVREGGNYNKRREVKCNLRPCVLARRLPVTGLGSAQGGQNLDGVTERSGALQQVGNVDREGDLRCCVGRQEEGGRDVQRDSAGQGLFIAEDYQVETNGGPCEQRCLTRLGEGEGQKEGVHLQARAQSRVILDNPSVFVAGMSASSSTEVAEPEPYVTGQETGQLYLLERSQYKPPWQQQQCREKGPVPSPGSVVQEETGGVFILPEDVRRQRQACSHCEFRGATRYTLTRHVERCHAGLKRLSPSHYDISSRRTLKLKEGIEMSPGGSREHLCPQCPYNASSPDYTKAHMETVNESLKKHKCSQCQFITSGMFQLQRQTETEHERLQRNQCEHCQFRDAYRGNLQSHFETVHEGLIKYPCPRSPYRAGLKETLQTHIEAVHEDARGHLCPHCPYRAGWRGCLQRHIETVHEGLRQHKCTYCAFRAGQKGELQTHMDTVHDDLRKHKCPHCPYKARQKSHLQTHMDTVHDGLRQHKCPHCPYKAGQKSHLQTHMDMVHEGLRKHECPHCPYKASQKYNLQRHIETVHDGLRKHKCPRCPYKAGQKSHLQRHIEEVHDGLRKYMCPHCPYKAGRNYHLQIHIEAVHENLMKYKHPIV